MMRLEVDIDEGRAEELLNLYLVRPTETLEKAFYDFDVTTPEGIHKLLILLPIMDEQMLFQVVTEIWPGYPQENFDGNRFRLEVKGYLLDYLETL